MQPTVPLPRWAWGPGEGRGLDGFPARLSEGYLLPFRSLLNCHSQQCHGEARPLRPQAWFWDNDPETLAHLGGGVCLHTGARQSHQIPGPCSQDPAGGLEGLCLPSCFPSLPGTDRQEVWELGGFRKGAGRGEHGLVQRPAPKDRGSACPIPAAGAILSSLAVRALQSRGTGR